LRLHRRFYLKMARALSCVTYGSSLSPSGIVTVGV